MAVVTCPTSEQLAALQAGSLSHEELETLAQHLETCAACQTAFDGVKPLPDTLAREVRLAQESDVYATESACGRVLQKIEAIIDHATTSSGRDTASRPAAITLGQYQLIDCIGKGGMGTVYVAWHTLLERKVALKVLSPGRVKDTDGVSRFRREIKAAGQLNDAHVVQTYDAGEADGQHFLVMEYLQGEDLQAVVARRGPLPVAEACDFIRQAALGLDCAHRHDMVHRDVKPSNLFLTADPAGKPLVKVLDLGLALLRESAAPDSDVTSTGQIMGTYDYMSAEQTKETHTVDRRSDIYSLGCTLYFLLSGKAPFHGRSAGQKLLAHQTEPLPAIARADVPSALSAIVKRMTEKDPARRFASMQEVVAELARIDTDTRPVARPSRGHVPLFAIATAVLLLLGIGIWQLPQIVIRIRDSKGNEKVIEVAKDAKIIIEEKKDVKNAPPLKLDFKPGQPLSRVALVGHPAPLPGVLSWTIETRAPRGQIRAFAASSDGRVATGGDDGTIRIWDAATGELKGALIGCNEGVVALAWSPDGTRLASIDASAPGREVRIWDATTGQLRNKFKTEYHHVVWSSRNVLAFSQAALELVDAGTGKTLKTIFPPEATFYSAIAWNSDGSLLAAARGNKIVLFDETGNLKKEIDTEKSIAKLLAWSPDGKFLAMGGEKNLWIWDASLEKTTSTLKIERVHGLAWSATSAQLLIGTESGLRLWDTTKHEQVTAIASPVGMKVAWFSATGRIAAQAWDRLWFANLKDQKTEISVHGHVREVARIAAAPDGKTLAAELPDGPDSGRPLNFWDISLGAYPGPLHELNEDMASPNWSPDMKLIAMLATQNVKVFDYQTGKLAFHYKKHQHAVRVLFIDNQTILSVDMKGQVHVWDALTGKTSKTFQIEMPPSHHPVPHTIHLSPDREKLVTLGQEPGVFHIWDIKTGKLAARSKSPEGGTEPLMGQSWSPKGDKIATVRDYKVRLWNASTGAPLDLLPNRGRWVQWLDEETLWWADQTHAHLLRAGAMNELKSYSFTADWSSGPVFFPNKKTIATHDRLAITLWETETGKKRGALLLLRDNQPLAISATGHYRGNPFFLGQEIVYIIQTAAGQETLSPEQFGKRFGWKNDPDSVRLIGGKKS